MDQNPADLKSKPHYEILDGLRGVAAIIVMASHLLEAHAANAFTQIINHGYPIYITHYSLIYLYTAWVGDRNLSLAQSYPGALLVFFGSFALAYACLKLYDEPARNWLKRRFLGP